MAPSISFSKSSGNSFEVGTSFEVGIHFQFEPSFKFVPSLKLVPVLKIKPSLKLVPAKKLVPALKSVRTTSFKLCLPFEVFTSLKFGNRSNNTTNVYFSNIYRLTGR